MAGAKKNKVVKTVVVKTKKSKPRNKNKKRSKSLSKRLGRMSLGGHLTSEYAKSILDPFRFAGCIPDGAAGTGCFTVKDSGTLTTGSTGSAYGILMTPNCDSFYIRDSGGSVAQTTIGANWGSCAGDATVDLLYEEARPVSAGIRVKYTGSTTNDQGVIVAAQFGSNVFPNSLNGLTLTSFCNAAMWFRVYALREGAVITWRPTAMTDHSMTRVQVSPLSSSTQAANSYIAVYVFSAATSGASSCWYELVANFEGRFKNQNILSGGNRVTQPAPAEPGWYEKAQQMVRGVLPYLPSTSDVIETGAKAARAYSAVRTMANGLSYSRQLQRGMLSL